jgi:tetratricopeptide (TPR) repeat protein
MQFLSTRYRRDCGCSPRSLGLLNILAVASVGLWLVAGCQRSTTTEPSGSQPMIAEPARDKSKAVGSKSCRDCHEEFYRLWSTSFHGLAMQPYSPAFAQEHLTAQSGDVTIGNRTYHAELSGPQGAIREIAPSGDTIYPIAHVMGGKNVYYFLTPMDRGRLQVLPLAYDVHKQTWYDVAASGVRHFADRRDEALDWTDRMFTFNTTCFNCHVSELSTNYDLAAETYHTTWSEPGIGCESCHGPAGEHIRVMEAAQREGNRSKDIKIIRTKIFTPEQTNNLCSVCHAKLVPLSVSFRPGDNFFDHYDLLALEHADFYPDGRDLGENYTYTSWLMSPCANSGKLGCTHCHASSGRMRFAGEKSNQACMPCHEKTVARSAEHSHHPAGGPGDQCIACHMPMTRFAAMGRSDHSMRPPTPATTMAMNSPNACNACHGDHDAVWADQFVRQWYQHDYQAEVLRRAELIDAARKHQWTRLSEMLAALGNKQIDAVYKTSLVRLLRGCPSNDKWPAILESLKDPSPLVRSSAASALGEHLTQDVLESLLAATRDESRLVRVRSALALAAVVPKMLADESDRQSLEKATKEFQLAMSARPDDWASYANLGNFYTERRDFPAAVQCFETAIKLEPRSVGALVSASVVYSNVNRDDDAEKCLRRALAVEPDNAAANFNLGLLLGQKQQFEDAEKALRRALKADPQMAPAAYNLGVLLADKNLDEAIAWCEKACRLRPNEERYAQALALFQQRQAARNKLRELGTDRKDGDRR